MYSPLMSYRRFDKRSGTVSEISGGGGGQPTHVFVDSLNWQLSSRRHLSGMFLSDLMQPPSWHVLGVMSLESPSSIQAPRAYQHFPTLLAYWLFWRINISFSVSASNFFICMFLQRLHNHFAKSACLFDQHERYTNDFNIF